MSDEQRSGQRLWNALMTIVPDRVESFRGGHLDPYHDDRRISAFLDALMADAEHPLGLDIIEVYVEHEEPLLYLAANARKEFFLCVLADDSHQERVWFFAPMTRQRTNDVRAGIVDLHDAFARVERGMVFALHRPRGTGAGRFETLEAASIGEERLPRPGERLAWSPA